MTMNQCIPLFRRSHSASCLRFLGMITAQLFLFHLGGIPHCATAQETKPRETVEVWIVSFKHEPGGPVYSNDYDDEEHATRAYDSLKTAKGINGEQLYFDVEKHSGKKPVYRPSTGYDPKPRDTSNGSSSRSPIELSNFKLVDPGPAAASRSSDLANLGAQLVGKKFSGSIAGTKFSFAFTSPEKVTLASPLASFEATWSFDNQGRLVIKAFGDTFVGDRKGQQFVGTVTRKTKTLSWSFDINGAFEADELAKGKAYNDPRDDRAAKVAPQVPKDELTELLNDTKWKEYVEFSSGGGSGRTVWFDKGGQYRTSQEDDSAGTWFVDGKTLTMKTNTGWEKVFEVKLTFEGKGMEGSFKLRDGTTATLTFYKEN